MNDVSYQKSREYLHNLWLWKCGLKEREIGRLNNYGILKKSEWCNDFEGLFEQALQFYSQGGLIGHFYPVFVTLMKNRLLMGALRYGRLRDFTRTNYDYISGILRYLKRYEETGNCEALVDVANYALIEYVRGKGVGGNERWMWFGFRGVTLADYLRGIRKLVTVYKVTGEKVQLSAIAALAFYAMERRVHPKHHFQGTDNTDLHCEIKI